MAEYNDNDRVRVFNRQTGITSYVRWGFIKDPQRRLRNQLELVDEPAPAETTEETKRKVEELKAKFKSRPAKVEPETVETAIVKGESISESETAPTEVEPFDATGKKKAELEAYLESKGVEIPDGAKKAELIELIENL